MSDGQSSVFLPLFGRFDPPCVVLIERACVQVIARFTTGLSLTLTEPAQLICDGAGAFGCSSESPGSRLHLQQAAAARGLGQFFFDATLAQPRGSRRVERSWRRS
jgi:hypothetical protein